MPFKSKAQRRWMYKNLPKVAKRWEKKYPSRGSLPSRVRKKKS
jgi:hypothetical protein